MKLSNVHTHTVFGDGKNTPMEMAEAALRASFVVPAICFAVVLAYALAFRKKKA